MPHRCDPEIRYDPAIGSQIGQVCLKKMKGWMSQRLIQIAARAARQIVDADDAVTFFEKPVCQMASHESSSSCDQHRFELRHVCHVSLEPPQLACSPG